MNPISKLEDQFSFESIDSPEKRREALEEAINTMYRALSEYVIEGVHTTIPFHLQLMQNEDFRKGNFTTKFLETFTMK